MTAKVDITVFIRHFEINRSTPLTDNFIIILHKQLNNNDETKCS